MIQFQTKDNYCFDDLLHIMEILRSPEGCMWDREQDHSSIRRNFLEETYEAVEAIDENDTEHLKEELGDVLLQVVFHTEMEREKGNFNMDDVSDGICKKLIFRHPHIFGDVKVSSSDEVLQNWDALKRIEKHQETTTDSMKSVARSLPQLIRAEKIQKKAQKVGFDWPNVSGAIEKVHEEAEELSQALNGQGNVEEELGDLLFAAVNVARFTKIDPEQALERASDKFMNRFMQIEQAAQIQGKALEEMSLSEMEDLWQAAKRREEDTREAHE